MMIQSARIIFLHPQNESFNNCKVNKSRPTYELINRPSWPGKIAIAHKLSGRIVRVEIHIQGAKGDALRLQPINDLAQMPDRARQSQGGRQISRRHPHGSGQS
jgi:hypothetical protein